ncbi:MAG: DUF6261 family protein [Agriterribacter sp.]
MLTTPTLKKYRQGDFVQYMNNVLQIISAARATTLNITSQRNVLQQAVQNLNDSWQPKTGSELTPEIAELDRQRDQCFTGLKLTVDNWAIHHYKSEFREAAFIISDYIAAHGRRITDLRYQLQTATLDAIISYLENEHARYIVRLGLQEWVSDLKALNEAFNTMYLARIKAVPLQERGFVKALIKTATGTFRQLKTMFEARFSVAVTDQQPAIPLFQQITNEWNVLTQQYNDVVNRNSSNDNIDTGTALQPFETE